MRPTNDSTSQGTTFQLRPVEPSDLDYFFHYMQDPEANHMAAFTSADPADRARFDAHWAKVMTDDTVLIRTILYGGEVAGSVLSYETDGVPEVSYWLGREYWGKGIATRALAVFLKEQTKRPINARVAKDNIASLRVLEKCGFRINGADKGYANARGCEIEEWLLELREE